MSLSLLCFLAISQNVFHTSAVFCLNFVFYSQKTNKQTKTPDQTNQTKTTHTHTHTEKQQKNPKQNVPKHLRVFLEVSLEFCLNQSLFKESFSLHSAPSGSPSGLRLYLLSMISAMPEPWSISVWPHSHSVSSLVCPGSSPVSLLFLIFNLIPG